MDAPASPFEVTETADGRVYRLPERKLGALHYLAILPLFIAVAGLTFIIQFAVRRAVGGQLNDWAWAALIATTLGWCRACYSLAALAAALWKGRAEIAVADNTAVVATDRAGWFRVRVGRVKPATARKLVLGEIVLHTDPSGKRHTVPGELWQLAVETDRGHKIKLAIGYPREILSALADELATRLSLAPVPQVNPETGEAVGVAELAPVPIVVEEPAVPSRDVLEQPANSRIELERHSNGVTVTVPAPGVMRSNCGLLVFGVIFGVVGTALLIAFINQQINPPPPRPRGKGDGPTWLGIVFLGVGVGAVLGAIHFGRKRAVLAVVGDQLLTFETGPLGSRRRSFIRAELLDIACGESNVKSNNKQLPQLQIIVVGGRAPVRMLTGRDETELMWLATVLRQSLGIPREPPELREEEESPGDD